MSDNPQKHKLDAKRISQQPWEQAYQRRKSVGKKKDAVAAQQALGKDADTHSDKKGLVRISHKRREVTIPDNRKLKSALLKMEKAVLQNPIRGKEPFAFCKEWEEKGKPIFNMVLVLFSFSAKTKTIIRRIMNGIDGVCSVSQESIVGSH